MIFQDDTVPGIKCTTGEDGAKKWSFRQLSWAFNDAECWVPSEWQWLAYERDGSEHKQGTLHGDGQKTLGNDVSKPSAIISISPGFHVPPEVFLAIVEAVPGCESVAKAKRCLAKTDEIYSKVDPDVMEVISTLDPWISGSWEDIIGLALACRSWFESYAPLVFSRIYVGEARVDEFRECIECPNSYIRSYARSLTVRGPCPFAKLGPLSTMLPHLLVLGSCSTYPRIVNDALEISHTHPEQTPATPQPLVGSGVRMLSLAHYQFPSLADLHLLVRSFPSLTTLILDDVTFDLPVEGHCDAPTSITPLTLVLMSPTDDTILHAVSLWTLAPFAGFDSTTTFPGVPDQELEFITAALPELDTVVIRLEQCSVRPDTCK